MPNWCYNKLKITADTEEALKQLKEFKERAKQQSDKDNKSDLLMDNFVTCPVELKETVSGFLKGDEQKALEAKQKSNEEKYGFPTWYEWSIANWGTRWDVSATLEEDAISEKNDYGFLSYVFDSAWSPPTIWLEKVSKMYPELYFVLRYEEEDMGFFGRAKAKNGEIDDQSLDA